MKKHYLVKFIEDGELKEVGIRALDALTAIEKVMDWAEEQLCEIDIVGARVK